MDSLSFNDDINLMQQLDEELKNEISHKIHLYIQQRNGRKNLTYVSGLSQEERPKFNKVWMKKFSCRSTIHESHPTYGDNIIQLTGDQRENIRDFLIENGYTKKDIITHGF